MIAAQCMVQVTDTTTGEVTFKARNLAMLAQAVRLQSTAAELIVKHHAAVWNQTRIEELYQVVIDEVGKVDRSLQQTVLARLRELSERRSNPGARFGIGVTPTTEAAELQARPAGRLPRLRRICRRSLPDDEVEVCPAHCAPAA